MNELPKRNNEAQARVDVGSIPVLGDIDEDVAMNCSTAWSAVCGGDLCYLSLDDMRQLAQLGFVTMLDAPPEDMPGAEYGYEMTDKGESLARKYREWLLSPNDPKLSHADGRVTPLAR